MNKNYLYVLCFTALMLAGCTTAETEEEVNEAEEMDKVDELRKSDEARMDSMRRELGVE